jgi:hypothetical protein
VGYHAVWAVQVRYTLSGLGESFVPLSDPFGTLRPTLARDQNILSRSRPAPPRPAPPRPAPPRPAY